MKGTAASKNKEGNIQLINLELNLHKISNIDITEPTIFSSLKNKETSANFTELDRSQITSKGYVMSNKANNEISNELNDECRLVNLQLNENNFQGQSSEFDDSAKKVFKPRKLMDYKAGRQSSLSKSIKMKYGGIKDRIEAKAKLLKKLRKSQQKK